MFAICKLQISINWVFIGWDRLRDTSVLICVKLNSSRIRNVFHEIALLASYLIFHRVFCKSEGNYFPPNFAKCNQRRRSLTPTSKLTGMGQNSFKIHGENPHEHRGKYIYKEGRLLNFLWLKHITYIINKILPSNHLLPIFFQAFFATRNEMGGV